MNNQLNLNCHKCHPLAICGQYTTSTDFWCPFTLDGRRNRYTIPIFDKIIARCGDWIAGEYISAHTEIQIMCERGHDWWVRPYSIKNGT